LTTLYFTKFSTLLTQVPVTQTKSESTKMDELFPKALNGFMLVLSSDGNMVYLSENVKDYLGVSQVCQTNFCKHYYNNEK